MAHVIEPTILHPRDGAILVDARAPLLVELTRLRVSGHSGTSDVGVKRATTTPPQNWINEARWTDGSTTLNRMASSAIPGRQGIFTFLGMTSPWLPARREINFISLRLRAAISWVVGTGPDKGTARVRVMVGIAGKIREVVDLNPTTQWLPSSTDPAPKFIIPLTAHYREALGLTSEDRLWVQDILDLAAEGYPRVHVDAYQGPEGYATNWGSNDGDLQIGRNFYDPDDQTALQIRAKLASDPTWASPVYDSGKVPWAERFWTIPPGALPDGEELELQAAQWDQLDRQSEDGAGNTWTGATSRFRTIPRATSVMLRGTPQDEAELAPVPTWVAVVRFGLWLDADAWDMSAITTHSVFMAELNRAAQPIPDFWIAGIEQGGEIGKRPEDWTELPGRSGIWSELQDASNEGAWAWIESAAEGVNARPELHIHPWHLNAHPGSGGEHPATLPAQGVMIQVAVAFSMEDGIHTGPDNLVRALPRLQSSPTFQDRLLNLELGAARTPSGELILDNADGLFNRILGAASGEPETGWVIHNRPVDFYLIPHPGKWEDRIHVFGGMVRWPKGNVEDGGQLRLQVQGATWELHQARVAGRKLSTELYPNLPDRNVGKVLAEFAGPDHRDQELLVVDKEKRLLRPGREVADVTDVKVAGESIGPRDVAWKYDPVECLVKVKRDYEDVFIANVLSPWTWSGDGAEFEGSTRYGPGAYARKLLLDAGVAPSRIDTASFDRVDTRAWADPDSDGWIRHQVIQETPLVDVLKLAEETGRFNVVWRPDGLLEAVELGADEEGGHSASTLVLQERQLLRTPATRVIHEHMGAVARVVFPGYEATAGLGSATPLEVTRRTDRVDQVWGLEGEVIRRTLHGDVGGALAWLDELEFTQPLRELIVPTDIRGLLSYVGERVVLVDGEALMEDGRVDWDVFKMVGRSLKPGGQVELVLRWLRRVGAWGRPWA